MGCTCPLKASQSKIKYQSPKVEIGNQPKLLRYALSNKVSAPKTTGDPQMECTSYFPTSLQLLRQNPQRSLHPQGILKPASLVIFRVSDFHHQNSSVLIKAYCFELKEQLELECPKSLRSALQNDNFNSGGEFPRTLEDRNRKLGRAFFS